MSVQTEDANRKLLAEATEFKVREMVSELVADDAKPS